MPSIPAAMVAVPKAHLLSLVGMASHRHSSEPQGTWKGEQKSLGRKKAQPYVEASRSYFVTSAGTTK